MKNKTKNQKTTTTTTKKKEEEKNLMLLTKNHADIWCSFDRLWTPTVGKGGSAFNI